MSTASPPSSRCAVAIVGGGPSGLMAAEVLAAAGVPAAVFDAMPSVGRKFLLAGKGGMNITHAEPFARFATRYREREAQIAPMLHHLDANAVREWAHGLGVETFVGSSQRVFPSDMKAAPLLRAWIKRLREGGTMFHMRHRWTGWDASERLQFSTPDGGVMVRAGATIFAMGGASWPRLGSDGAWVDIFREKAILVRGLIPSNCGFEVAWSAHLRERFAGQPVKSVAISFRDASGQEHHHAGECLITQHGIEGGLIYALSAPLRDTIAAMGSVTVSMDLTPGRSLQRVLEEVRHPRGARSLSSHLQSRLGIHGVKAALLREALPREVFTDPSLLGRLAEGIKALPLTLQAARPIAEAISSAGGVSFDALDGNLMLKTMPGVFCTGEMLDWEAPTGGYLLTACLASGRTAGAGAVEWLRSPESAAASFLEKETPGP